MDDLERQIRAWADHHAPHPDDAVGAQEVIDAPDVVHRPPRPSAGERPDGRRRGSSRRLAAAAAVLIAGLAAVLFAATRDEGTDVVSDVPDPPSSSSSTTTTVAGEAIPFELLGSGTGDGSSPMAALAAATNQSDLNTRWALAGLDGSAPGIDFSERAIVAVTVPDGACPPSLDGFVRHGSDVTPTFARPTDSCIDPFVPTTYVVALSWDDTGDSFRLVLPADSVTDLEATLQVERPPDTAAFTNPAEDALITALERLGLEGCCGEPSHGGDDATYGAMWDGIAIPIRGAPQQDHTDELDGERKVLVPFNDLVTASAAATIDDAEVLTGDADFGPFVAFTCGPNLWTVGGVTPGDRAAPGQVRNLTAALLSELGCEPGERPVATGGSDPSGE